ncbi:MAG: hypothetical protein QOH62_1131 [Solirubrobacteraceae bacterium]|jgi:hypothetical protein|nr:hypothetical protein [Solirubrobacteraceae bacterium]
MSLLLLRLVLAPALVVGVSLAARRWGATAGGVLTALPVVNGPVLLVIALDHGTAFGSRAATASLLGLLSLAAFVVAHAAAARRLPPLLALAAGWAGFGVATAALSPTHVPVGAAYALVLAGAALAWGAVGRIAGGAAAPPVGPPPRGDLPVRAAAAAILVLALTLAAGALGPHLSGLLAPFPVAASVLLGFTHAQRGATEAAVMGRGLLVGFLGFGAFNALVALELVPLGVAGAFALAAGVSVAVQALVLGARIVGRVRENAAPCPSPASRGS